MWTISSPLADSLFSWSNAVLVVGAALVLIGTMGAIKMGAIREHYADLRISDNERETAKANERAAELEKEAANARLDTEKLKAVVAWRTISESQIKELDRVLAARPGSLNLRWMDGDPEALFFAIQISQILGSAHWQVGAGSLKPANGIVFGVIIPPVAGADADTLRQAFAAAKIGYSSVPLDQSGASFNVTTIPDAPFLMIGSRMPVTP